MQTKWAEIIEILEKSIAPAQYKVWIEPLIPVWDEHGLCLVAPSDFMANFIRNRYFSQIEDAVHQAAPSCEQVRLSDQASAPVSAPPKKRAEEPESLKMASNTTSLPPLKDITVEVVPPVHPQAPGQLSGKETTMKNPKPTPKPLAPLQLTLPTPLPAPRTQPAQNWRFSFEDFVVGSSNELAYAASRSMCNAGQSTDILFLNSTPGLGKTHLMHAVGKQLSVVSNRTQPKVEYLTAEEFASRFIHSIRTNDTEGFKARYRNLDLLLLEDIHFLSGKEKTQYELLNTIKALQERGGRLVCTSSFAPKELQKFDGQLISRLRSGFLSSIDIPDQETRKRIFRHKARLHQVFLPQDVEETLAEHIQSDVRLIESCLQTLLLKAQLFNGAITMQMAWDVISNYTNCSPALDLPGILQQVCQVFGLTQNQLLSNSRKQEYVSARYMAFFLARKHTALSLENIGQFFNRRHSTVLKGITQLERQMSLETPSGKQLANVISMIEKNTGTNPIV